MLLRLVEQMSKCSWDPVVMLMNRGWLYDELCRRGIRPIHEPSRHSFDLPFLWRFVSFLRRERIDLIHSHLPDSNAYACAAGTLARTPVLATYHGLLETFGPLSRTARAKLGVVRHLASRVVAVSEYMRQEFISRAGFASDRIVTIYNGIDWSRIDRAEPRDRARAALGLPAATPVLGMVGTVRPVKGHVFALRALRRIRETLPNAVLLIVGFEEYPYRHELEREVNALELGEAVRFLGFRSDVASVMQAFDVFTMPSLSEGHPLATIEALGARLPVVASAVGGHPEIVQGCPTATLVPPGDVTQLADRLLELLTTRRPTEEALSEVARNIRSRFSLEQMIAQHDALYRETLGAWPVA